MAFASKVERVVLNALAKCDLSPEPLMLPAAARESDATAVL